MQKINIDEIIVKLKKSDYWKKYKISILSVIWNKDREIVKKYINGGIGEIEKYKPQKKEKIENKKDFIDNEKENIEILDLCIGKKGILLDEIELLIGNKNILEKINNSEINEENIDFWNWSKFDDLKKEFLELFFEKINYCPNCGKSPYLSTGKLNLKSFDLDHFFPKSKNFYLMFNFYNLIPICSFCNQRLKRDKNPLLKIDKESRVFNPYFGWLYKEENKIKVIDSDFDSKISFYGKAEKKQIFKTMHSDFFKLSEIYLKSKDTSNTFNFIQDKRTKIKNELNNFKVDFGKLIEEEKNHKLEKYKNYFFKNYYPKNEEDILKFANGKLKKDLIENIKI